LFGNATNKGGNATENLNATNKGGNSEQQDKFEFEWDGRKEGT
jgi:hypothetical protein